MVIAARKHHIHCLCIIQALHLLTLWCHSKTAASCAWSPTHLDLPSNLARLGVSSCVSVQGPYPVEDVVYKGFVLCRRCGQEHSIGQVCCSMNIHCVSDSAQNHLNSWWNFKWRVLTKWNQTAHLLHQLWPGASITAHTVSGLDRQQTLQPTLAATKCTMMREKYFPNCSALDSARPAICVWPSLVQLLAN